MPAKKEKVEVRINDPQLDGFLRLLASTRNQLSKLRPGEEQLKATVGAKVDAYLKDYSADIIRTSDAVTVTITQMSGSPHIDGKILLENGVSPQVIQKATRRTPFTTLKVAVTD